LSTSPVQLHPRRGPHQPALGTPSRRPGSIRRTTTHDSLRPDGLVGDVLVDGRGRDLRTNRDESTTTVGEARLDARIAFVSDRRIVSIQAQPAADLEPMVGLRASSGFRQALDELMPDEDRVASLRYQLLDDLPTAVLVSGFALSAGGLHPPRGAVRLNHLADICAGWATGGTILTEAAELGYPPVVTGPVAPALSDGGDPDAWHPVGALPAHAMRRWRRIDVWRQPDHVAVDCLFRDSHVDADGSETVLHEYGLVGSLDPAGSRFRSLEAVVGALPWVECPQAASSAGRLNGMPVADLRSWVRENFTGTSTCTHLNDTLRALACLPYLVASLDTAA
jgi:hypothetical protein